MKYSKNAPKWFPIPSFPFQSYLSSSFSSSLSIRDCKIGNTLHFHSTLLIWSKVTLCSAKNRSIWIRDSAPNPDRELLCPGLYLLEFLKINIDENIGQPMLLSIPNENAYLNRVVKPIYELCVEVEGSIMGTTISIEKNNSPIYACCNRSVFSIIISVFKSLVYGGRSFDFQELKSAIHQMFSVPIVFASTKCSMISPWEAKAEGGVHSRMGYGKQQVRIREVIQSGRQYVLNLL